MSLNFLTESNTHIPLVLASAHHPIPLLDLIQTYHKEIKNHLNQHGALLFRGFACQDADHFSQAITLCALGNRCNTKEYDLPRTYLPNDICLSTDLAPHIPLALHHEKPRSKTPPNHIYFCSVTPATQGGATIFANAEAVWTDMPRNIQDKILEHGVVYKQYFHGPGLKHKGLKKVLINQSALEWAEYFATTDKKAIEQFLMESELQFKWINKEKDLIVLNQLAGVLEHPTTKKTLWFNACNYLNYYTNVLYDSLKQLPLPQYLAYKYLMHKDAFPLVCHYGNGHAFSAEDIRLINQVLDKHTKRLFWNAGDFMIVDNYTFMHGKEAHEGDRLLYSCITQYE